MMFYAFNVSHRIFHVAFWIVKKLDQRPCTVVQGILPKMTRREFPIFIIFPDTYTCPYAV